MDTGIQNAHLFTIHAVNSSVIHIQNDKKAPCIQQNLIPTRRNRKALQLQKAERVRRIINMELELE